MTTYARLRTLALSVASVAALAIVLVSAPNTWSQQSTVSDPARRSVVSAEFLGVVTFRTGTTFADTDVGGLSAITYDPEGPAGTYYALSDDRSQRGPARFYTVRIDLADGTLDDGDVVFEAVTTLRDVDGEPFAAGAIDPEGIALSTDGTLFISSEGDAGQLIAPWVRELTVEGTHIRELPPPDYYAPNEAGDRGIRHNLAFEPLTITPDGLTLLTGTENALQQDGPAVSLDAGSPSRLLSYDVTSGEPGAEYVYNVAPVPQAPEPPDAFADNGLVEHIALDNVGTLLSMERSYAVGPGNTVRLFETRTSGALNVEAYGSLTSEDTGETFDIDAPAEKRFVADFAELGVKPDNLEGMALGPRLPDGRQSLIVVSDNNFNPVQITQFIALALEIEEVPLVPPAGESPQLLMSAAGPGPRQQPHGFALDTAILEHTNDPADTRIVAAVGYGGVLLLDKDGQFVASTEPQQPGGRYTGVDVWPIGFLLSDGSTVDLALVADNAHSTLDVFAIGENSLEPLTSESMPAPILPDGEGLAALGVATYFSPVSAERFAFVTHRGGNRVAQLKLLDDGTGHIFGELVRTVELPVQGGDASGGSAFGIAVEPNDMKVYVAFTSAPAIVSFDAEPDALDEPQVVIEDVDELRPPLGGLALGPLMPDGAFTLLVAQSADSSVAVFDLDGGYSVQGRLVVAGDDDIDAAFWPRGIAFTGQRMPPTYPEGMLVVSDLSDEPQVHVEFMDPVPQLVNEATSFKLAPWRSDLWEHVDPEQPTLYLPLCEG